MAQTPGERGSANPVAEPLFENLAATGPTQEEAASELRSAQNELGRIRREIDENTDNDAALTNLRIALEDLADEMVDLGVRISPRLSDIRARLDQLGDPPGEGEPPEPELVSEERMRLAEERAEINALLGSAEELSLASSREADRVTEMRRSLFAETLVTRTPVDGELLREARAILASERAQFVRIVGNWADYVWDYQRNALLQVLLITLAAALILLSASRRIFARLAAHDPQNADPSYVTRLAVAFWSTVIPSAVAAISAAALYGLMQSFDLLRPTVSTFVALALSLAVALYFLARLTLAVLAPAKPKWRLINVSTRGSRTLALYVMAITFVSGADYFSGGVSTALGSDVAVTVAKTFFSVIIIGILLIAVSFVRPMVVEGDEATIAAMDVRNYNRRRRFSPYIAVPLRVSGIALIVLALAGYVGLARFISLQIIITGAILGTMYIGFLCGRGVSSSEDFSSTSLGRLLSQRLKLGPVAMDQVSLAASLGIYSIVVLLGVPLILLQWGFQPQDIQRWAYRLVTEIRLGSISISLVGIFFGVLVFVIALFATRWFQRWIDGNVMARGRVDLGVRNSIRTAVGYAGVAIAGLIAVSAAGLNLSNLALVAGALSLGIGFGLQTIVSNFVSGLILLAERPFKAGDWVVTGTTEGFVKRISVRSTEIETFQRQSIMVPNSELINSAVGNWTHRNQLGRIEIKVRVTYDSDPDLVIAILYEVASQNGAVMRNPEPIVVFTHFGEYALEFELRVFLGDILLMLEVQTELRLAILKRFREEGIKIPYPKRDLNIWFGDEQDETQPETPPASPSSERRRMIRRIGQRYSETLDDPDFGASEVGNDGADGGGGGDGGR